MKKFCIMVMVMVCVFVLSFVNVVYSEEYVKIPKKTYEVYKKAAMELDKLNKSKFELSIDPIFITRSKDKKTFVPKSVKGKISYGMYNSTIETELKSTVTEYGDEFHFSNLFSNQLAISVMAGKEVQDITNIKKYEKDIFLTYMPVRFGMFSPNVCSSFKRAGYGVNFFVTKNCSLQIDKVFNFKSGGSEIFGGFGFNF